MKYSQYHEARQLFETDLARSYGYDLQEWEKLPPKEKAEELNEVVGLGPLTLFGIPLAKAGIAAGAGLLGLGIAFRKKLAQKARLRKNLKKLKKEADKFKKKAMQGLEKAIAPQVEAKKKIKASEGVDSWKDLSDGSKKDIARIEEKIANVLTDYVNKVAKIKTEQIYTVIDSNKKLLDSTKLALKFSWETMAAETKVSLLAELMKDKVIESPVVIAGLDEKMEEEKTDLENKQKDVVNKINKAAKEEKKAKEEKPEEPKPEERDEEADKYKVGNKFVLDHEKLGGEVSAEIINIKDDGKIQLNFTDPDGDEKTVTITPDNLEKIIKETKVGEEKPEGTSGEIKGEKL